MHSAAYGRTCSISDASEPAIWKPMTRSSLADTTTLTSSFTSLRPSVFFMGLACVAQELGFKKTKTPTRPPNSFAGLLGRARFTRTRQQGFLSKERAMHQTSFG